jgi:hypothetical protein
LQYCLPLVLPLFLVSTSPISLLALLVLHKLFLAVRQLPVCEKYFSYLFSFCENKAIG